MKPILFLFFVTFLSLQTCVGQGHEFYFGMNIKDVKTALKSKGANITQGMTNEGIVYLMDEDWDGLAAWFFDDTSICNSFYTVVKSKKGKEGLINFKLIMGESPSLFEKVDNNTYKSISEGLYFNFTAPKPDEIALLVYRKE